MSIVKLLFNRERWHIAGVAADIESYLKGRRLYNGKTIDDPRVQKIIWEEAEALWKKHEDSCRARDEVYAMSIMVAAGKARKVCFIIVHGYYPDDEGGKSPHA
jgi:hypothetical protein